MNNNKNHKKTVKQYIEKVVNDGDVERIPQCISDDYAEIYKNKRDVAGI